MYELMTKSYADSECTLYTACFVFTQYVLHCMTVTVMGLGSNPRSISHTNLSKDYVSVRALRLISQMGWQSTALVLTAKQQPNNVHKNAK